MCTLTRSNDTRALCAASRNWSKLPPDVLKQLSATMFVHKTAVLMKTITLEALAVRRNGLSTLRITTTPGVSRQTYMGRSMINPCYQCDMADMTGMGGYCGRCRSQPRSCRHYFAQGVFGSCGEYTDRSPRQAALHKYPRQICPVCKKLYRNNWPVVDFIAEEGGCVECFHSGALD